MVSKSLGNPDVIRLTKRSQYGWGYGWEYGQARVSDGVADLMGKRIVDGRVLHGFNDGS